MESLRKPTTTDLSTSDNQISAYKNKRDYFYDKTKKWIRQLTVISAVLYALISTLSLFLYIDYKNGCFITLEPGFLEFNNGSIVEGIKLIKKISPTDYKDLCQNVKQISPNVGCGGVHGGCYYESRPNKIYVNASNRDLIWNAEVLIHETCHSMQGNESRPFSEEECYDENERLRRLIVEY